MRRAVHGVDEKARWIRRNDSSQAKFISVALKGLIGWFGAMVMEIVCLKVAQEVEINTTHCKKTGSFYPAEFSLWPLCRIFPDIQCQREP